MRRFQQGKVRVNHKKFMGYDKDENGELVINEKEVNIVRSHPPIISKETFERAQQEMERRAIDKKLDELREEWRGW